MSLIERKAGDRQSVAIETTDATRLAATRKRLNAAQRKWLEQTGFEAAPGTFALLADASGKLQRVLAGVDAADALNAIAHLPKTLPEGSYHLADEGVLADKAQAALGWALGAYEFTRYRKAKRASATLAVPAAELKTLAPLAAATAQVRDLVNAPTEDMHTLPMTDGNGTVAAPAGALVVVDPRSKVLRELPHIGEFQQWRKEQVEKKMKAEKKS